VLKKFIGDKGGCTITKPTFQENTQYNPLVSQLKKNYRNGGLLKPWINKKCFL
jgi:hypothetical protein